MKRVADCGIRVAIVAAIFSYVLMMICHIAH